MLSSYAHHYLIVLQMVLRDAYGVRARMLQRYKHNTCDLIGSRMLTQHNQENVQLSLDPFLVRGWGLGTRLQELGPNKAHKHYFGPEVSPNNYHAKVGLPCSHIHMRKKY